MRRGNIELSKIPSDNDHFEICKWNKNTYFGRESEFNLVGDDMYYKSDYRCGVHKSCFEREEYKYTVAYIRNGVVSFIGDRAIDLDTESDLRDLLWIVRVGISKSLRWKVK